MHYTPYLGHFVPIDGVRLGFMPHYWGKSYRTGARLLYPTAFDLRIVASGIDRVSLAGSCGDSPFTLLTVAADEA